VKKTFFFANLCWLALAGLAALGSWRLEVGSLHSPGAGFLPFYAAILFGALAFVSLLQDLKDMTGPASEIWGGVRWDRWLAMVASLFIYVAVLDWLGFMLATFLLMLVLFRLLEPYRWTTVILFSLLTMGSAYLFFVVLLDSRLPRGSLWGF
jgi:putative tricarboxylic transport membrane protein